MAMQLTDSVTGDLIRVALSHGDGRLEHAPALAQALRGALLIDLTRMGRLTSGPEGTEVDTSPTGWALADTALRDIDDHPTATMERLIQHGRPHLDEFVDELVTTGVWRIARAGISASHRRYEDTGAATFQSMLARFRGVVVKRAAAAKLDERTAAVAVLAEVIGLTQVRSSSPVRTELLRACGPVEPITSDVVAFVQGALAIDLASGRMDRQTGVWAP